MSFSSGELSGELGGESAADADIVAITSTWVLSDCFRRSGGTAGLGGRGATFFSNTEGVFTLYAGPGTRAPVLWVRGGMGNGARRAEVRKWCARESCRVRESFAFARRSGRVAVAGRGRRRAAETWPWYRRDSRRHGVDPPPRVGGSAGRPTLNWHHSRGSRLARKRGLMPNEAYRARGRGVGGHAPSLELAPALLREGLELRHRARCPVCRLLGNALLARHRVPLGPTGKA